MAEVDRRAQWLFYSPEGGAVMCIRHTFLQADMFKKWDVGDGPAGSTLKEDECCY